MMFCPDCNTPCDDDAIFCGDCGKQVAPTFARGATVAEPFVVSRSNGLRPNAAAYGNVMPSRKLAPSLSPLRFPSSFAAHTPTPTHAAPAHTPLSPAAGSIPSFPLHDLRKNLTRNIFIGLVLFLLVTGASAGFLTLIRSGANSGSTINNGNAKGTGISPVGPNNSGSVFFSDAQSGNGDSNALELQVSGLSAPPTSSQYYAWMIDTGLEKILPLGVLTAQGQNFHLTFTGKANLLGAGNKLEITQEQGMSLLPTGNIVLSGTLPALSLIHIRHLLVKFDTTPGNIGLLVGLRGQASVLNAQAALLQSLMDKGQSSIGCVAQSIVNIIEGQQGKNSHPLADTCTALNITNVGDGFALLNPAAPNDGYIILSAEHASLAATQTDSTNVIKTHAQHVQVAMENLRQWVTTIDKDAQYLVAHPNDPALIPEIVTLSAHTLNGADLNDNGRVDPALGEAGAITAYNEGQLMAQLTLGPDA